VPAAAALAGVAAVHLLDGPGSLSDHFYIGGLELALAAACAPLAVLLAIRPTRAIWTTSLALGLAAISAYILSRTVGLPGAADDIGNWGQLLGVINLAVEGIVVAVALMAIPSPRLRAQQKPQRSTRRSATRAAW
jgi:hypothetical protein